MRTTVSLGILILRLDIDVDSSALDATLRYWEFIETHPGHTGLPAGTSEEAVEALSWCYTGE